MSNDFTREKPVETGMYRVRSEETGSEGVMVKVMLLENELVVEDPDIGVYPLDRYYSSLRNSEWRKTVAG